MEICKECGDPAIEHGLCSDCLGVSEYLECSDCGDWFETLEVDDDRPCCAACLEEREADRDDLAQNWAEYNSGKW